MPIQKLFANLSQHNVTQCYRISGGACLSARICTLTSLVLCSFSFSSAATFLLFLSLLLFITPVLSNSLKTRDADISQPMYLQAIQNLEHMSYCSRFFPKKIPLRSSEYSSNILWRVYASHSTALKLALLPSQEEYFRSPLASPVSLLFLLPFLLFLPLLLFEFLSPSSTCLFFISSSLLLSLPLAPPFSSARPSFLCSLHPLSLA